jgi:hypothetical protein
MQILKYILELKKLLQIILDILNHFYGLMLIVNLLLVIIVMIVKMHVKKFFEVLL